MAQAAKHTAAHFIAEERMSFNSALIALRGGLGALSAPRPGMVCTRNAGAPLLFCAVRTHARAGSSAGGGFRPRTP